MNAAALSSAYLTLKNGAVWRKWATANPGEVTKMNAYVSALASGSNPAIPAFSTDTGKGLAGMLHAAAGDAAGAIVETVPSYAGPITVVTKDDGETVQVLIDGKVVRTMGPQAVTQIDTRELANGQHTFQTVSFDAAGREVSRTGVATFQTRN